MMEYALKGMMVGFFVPGFLENKYWIIPGLTCYVMSKIIRHKRVGKLQFLWWR
jgi:hypothetical protein